MARYNSITGPAGNLELTGVLTPVPGMRASRTYDDGELLILAHVNGLNTTAAQIQVIIEIQLDGAAIAALRQSVHVLAGLLWQCAAAVITSIAEGPHTIVMLASGDAAVGDFLLGSRCGLTIIQLPVWDAETGIITL